MIGLKLSWRYFWHRRISILAVASVALCVFIVVVVMSVMNGLVQDFKDKNHRFVGDCVLSTSSLTGFPYAKDFIAQLESQPFVAAVSETIQGTGLATSRIYPSDLGIEYMGIDPVKHSQVTGFASALWFYKDNPKDVFVAPYLQQVDGCVPGIDLVLYRMDTGQYDQLERPPLLRFNISGFPLSPKGGLARAGVDIVSTKTFAYSDHSHTGLVGPDGGLIYLPLEQARLLSGMDAPVVRSSAIHIRFAEGLSVDAGTEKVRSLWQSYIALLAGQPYTDLLSAVRVQTWQQNRREFIGPMEKEQLMLTLLFLMLGIVTIFIIFVVFYMIIGHKTRDLGVLKSIGMPTPSVAAVFLGFAAIVGLIGSIIGITSGSLFLWKINAMENWLYDHYGWRIWDRGIYAIDQIPNAIEWPLLAVVAGCAVAACLLGAIVPSIQAAIKSPVRVLQVSQL